MKKRIAKKIIKYLVSDSDNDPHYQIYQNLRAYQKLGKKYCLDHYQIEKLTLINTMVRFEDGKRIESRMNPFLHIEMKMIAMYDESMMQDLIQILSKQYDREMLEEMKSVAEVPMFNLKGIWNLDDIKKELE